MPKQFAFKDIRVFFLGRDIATLQGIKYKTSVEKERVFGRGNKALSIQTGNEMVEGSITILQSELEQMILAVQAVNPTGNITDVAFDITNTYGNGNTATTDLIIGAEITEFEKGMQQNDKFMTVELPFIALSVVYNKV